MAKKKKLREQKTKRVDSLINRESGTSCPIFVDNCNAKEASAGMSVSDFLRRAVKENAERPSIEEIADSLSRRDPIRLGTSAAQLVRQERSRA